MKELGSQLAESAAKAASSISSRAIAMIAITATTVAVGGKVATPPPADAAGQRQSLVCYKDPSTILPVETTKADIEDAQDTRRPDNIKIGGSAVRLFAAGEMPQKRGCAPKPKKPGRSERLNDRLPSRPAPQLPPNRGEPAPIPLAR